MTTEQYGQKARPNRIGKTACFPLITTVGATAGFSAARDQRRGHLPYPAPKCRSAMDLTFLQHLDYSSYWLASLSNS
jgi:hypothetical protein